MIQVFKILCKKESEDFKIVRVLKKSSKLLTLKLSKFNNSIHYLGNVYSTVEKTVGGDIQHSYSFNCLSDADYKKYNLDWCGYWLLELPNKMDIDSSINISTNFNFIVKQHKEQPDRYVIVNAMNEYALLKIVGSDHCVDSETNKDKGKVAYLVFYKNLGFETTEDAYNQLVSDYTNDIDKFESIIKNTVISF